MEFAHRGYRGVLVGAEHGRYRGRVAGIKDVVTFVGVGHTFDEIMASLRAEFVASVDSYLEFVESLGQEPDAAMAEGEEPTDG